MLYFFIILTIIILILSINLGILLSYKESAFCVQLSVLWFKFFVVGGEDKNDRKTKELKKEKTSWTSKNREKKKNKKDSSEKNKREKKSKKNKSKAMTPEKVIEIVKNLDKFLGILTEALVRTLSVFKKHFKIKNLFLLLQLGTGNHANTAIYYGYISGISATLLSLITRVFTVDEYYVFISPDFMKKRVKLEFELDASFRVVHIMCMLIILVIAAVRLFIKYVRITKAVKD